MSKGVTQFTVEQPAQLNHLVDDTIPLTWQVRWQGLKVCLPLLVFSSACIVELFFISAWLADQMAGVWMWLVLGFLFPPILVLMMTEVQMRINHIQKRRLSFKKSGLVFRPKDLVLRWKDFAGLRFEPIIGQPQLNRCYILGRGKNQQTVTRPRWSLVLDAAQKQALLGALPDYCPPEVGKIRIEEAKTVELPARPRRIPFTAMSLYLLGMFLCLNGAPLAFVFRSGERFRSQERTSDLVISERRGKQMTEFIKLHFQNVEEFRVWVFWAGATLTVLGSSAIVGGIVMLSRISQSSDRGDTVSLPSFQTPYRAESAAPLGNSESSRKSPK